MSAMPLRTHIPRAPLSDFVELFWLWNAPAAGHPKERLLPDGSMELIIDLLGDNSWASEAHGYGRRKSFMGGMIIGAHSKFFEIDTSCPTSVMGVHFKPGGAYPFLSPPSGEFHGVVVPFDAVWGGRAGDLRERLLETTIPEARFHILEEFLVAQAVRPLVRRPAVAFALKELKNVGHTRTVSEVIGQIGLSERRFIQIFRDQVGLTPKLYFRVQRFQEVIWKIGNGRPINWADAAVVCGYYDQAHFIHDLRAFSGLSPTAYVAKQIERPNHVPLYD